METKLRDNLLALKSAYIGATGASESTVAQAACGDWRFFERIQGKASFTVRTYDRAVRWFLSKWPTDLPWPENVERPPPEEPSSDPSRDALAPQALPRCPPGAVSKAA